jgi:hypothetical protein
MIAPTRATNITVTFTSFSTEEGYDYVRLFACEDASCASAQMFGELTGEYDSEQSFSSGASVVLVEFTSDGSVQGDGFTAVWFRNSVSASLSAHEICNSRSRSRSR